MRACARHPYLDPNIAVGSQGRVIQAGGGAVAGRPPEGGRGPEDDAPPKFEQRDDGAQGAVRVDERPVAHNSDVPRKSGEK